MFRGSKDENKAKLERKLYLAKETPEPIFDLSQCGIKSVPKGIYSLCKVFLKRSLHLEYNNLTSLSGGGDLKDLHLLEHLNLGHNLFTSLAEDIYLLKNLQELYINNNKLKILPNTISRLRNLKILDVSNNNLKFLPDNLGDLVNLLKLKINGNQKLQKLPKSTCKAQRLLIIDLDSDMFEYPPKDVAAKGTVSIMQFICNDIGFDYVSPEDLSSVSYADVLNVDEEADQFEQQKAHGFLENERIKELEEDQKMEQIINKKQQKAQDFLDIERNKELQQRQELDAANAHKINREKLLEAITDQQNLLDKRLTTIHKSKENEKFHLIEQLQEVENKASEAIERLLELNNEPQRQLMEQEKEEEERLLKTVIKYNERLRKDSILNEMQAILQQENEEFDQFLHKRRKSTKTILEQELESDLRLSEILKTSNLQKMDLISKIQEDEKLQKAAVGNLLVKGDARSWSLLQKVRLVENQLANLTSIEIDRKKLNVDKQLNDLSYQRINLSALLLDLLQQQKERKLQLVSTLECMEENNECKEDFWLRQYQSLLDQLPGGLSLTQKNIDPALGQALLANGVIHCLPFLAKITQRHCNINEITEAILLEAGIADASDRVKILDAFQTYTKENSFYTNVTPSAPPLLDEASAPPMEESQSITTECVVCLDLECQVIFLPCGHLCCCPECSSAINKCPMCRTNIEGKIKVIAA